MTAPDDVYDQDSDQPDAYDAKAEVYARPARIARLFQAAE